MKLVRLYLSAFGPFTDRVIELGSAGQPVVLIHGPNEAGKSATRRAIGDLRFGIGHSSTDAFRHPYAAMRVGGVFLDPQGQEIGLMRRKGKGQTLSRRDPRQMDQESAEPLNPLIEGWLTGGLSRDEYATRFGLDHAGLRRGGQALLEGEGEVGAALFEASAGVGLEGGGGCAYSVYIYTCILRPQASRVRHVRPQGQEVITCMGPCRPGSAAWDAPT